MSKRISPTLVVAPALLFGLLLFLSQTTAARGGAVALDPHPLSFAGAPLLQGATESEPNDTLDTADPVDVNLTMEGTIPLVQPTDIDWYQLILSQGDLGRDFTVTLDEQVPDGDYKLELNLYNAEGSLVDSDSGNSSSTLEWSASVITYYLRIRADDFDTVTAPGDADYDFTVFRIAAEPPTATPVPWDACEVNDDIDGTWSADTPPGGPCLLSVGVATEDLNFIPYSGQPVPNDDYFTFLAKAGRTYRISTDVQGGADTEMWLYDPGNSPITYDDDGGTGAGSRIEATLAEGFHKVLVRDRLGSTSPSADQTYDILVEDITPATSTPTPTAGPGVATSTPTVGPPIPGAPDRYDSEGFNNNSFERATLIDLGAKYTNLNFVPPPGATEDTDFFKLWLVPGKLYTCETLDLDTATNTNMILCSGPSWEQCFQGNDDVQPFDPADPYRSYIKFFSSYKGYLYIMLGQVGADKILPEEWQHLSYSLQCYIDQPGTATPTPTSEFDPPTPQPTSTSAPNTPVPTASATPVRIVVRTMVAPTPPPTVAPAATPTPGLYVIELSLYYDQNQNGQRDTGEGISSALARAYDALSGEVLSIDYTDETGYLRFAVPGRGPVRVSVPFFGFNQIVTSNNAQIELRISPGS